MNPLKKVKAASFRLSMLGLPRGPHITRYFMYEHLRSVGKKLPVSEGRVLSISHSEDLCTILNLRPSSLFKANYPDHNLASLEFHDESFDFVVSDQVLEHIEGNPQQAIDESWRVLRPGGIACHTTCFMNPVHGAPSDYWRFTPAALELLCKRFSRIIDCAGWGNFEALVLIREGLRADKVPHAKWHPLHRIATTNDLMYPIVTWVIAQK